MKKEHGEVETGVVERWSDVKAGWVRGHGRAISSHRKLVLHSSQSEAGSQILPPFSLLDF